MTVIMLIDFSMNDPSTIVCINHRLRLGIQREEETDRTGQDRTTDDKNSLFEFNITRRLEIKQVAVGTVEFYHGHRIGMRDTHLWLRSFIQIQTI